MWLTNKILKSNMKLFCSTAPTIFALSSGQGKCGVAVVRISGSKASEAILKMTNCKELPKPRVAKLNYIKDPETLEELDKGLILWFPGPKSFTGEDSCEFQIHGGPAVVASVLTGLSKLPHFRPAEPGDFTRRAFFSGKLDLTEVEGLGDLIHAETEFQRKQALLQMEGNLSSLYKNWRNTLIKSLAHVEAYIDFSESESIEDNILKIANDNLCKLRVDIQNHLTDGRKGERLRDGIHTAIVGEPNAGKSSLLNIICQRPAAIVTPIPGTTRDVIELHINMNGFPVTLIDTAGLRESTSDIIEREGILRAQRVIEKADLVLLVVDVGYLQKFNSCLSNVTVNEFLNNHIKHLKLEKILPISQSKNYRLSQLIVVINKIDLLTTEHKTLLLEAVLNEDNINCISCTTEEGFQEFLKNFTEALRQLCGNPSRENPSLTQSRHRYHLNASLKFLNEYFELISEDVTLAAQKLRLSSRQLGKILGTVNSDEILDEIFKNFCVGK